MDITSRHASTLRTLSKDKDDWVFRLEGATNTFISLPWDKVWMAYVLATTGASLHEVLGFGKYYMRVYFDIEIEENGIGWNAINDWNDHTMIAKFAEFLRETLSTRVIVATASKSTKVSYHVWCLDIGAVNVGSMKELCFSLMDESPLPIYWFDTGVYTKNKSMRIYGSSKYGENRPFKLVTEASDEVDFSEYGWRFIQGDVERVYKSTATKTEVTSKVVPENYEKAAEIVETRYPGLRASSRVNRTGIYRANRSSSCWCHICEDEHTSDNMGFVPLSTGVRIICHAASRRDTSTYRAKRSEFVLYNG